MILANVLKQFSALSSCVFLLSACSESAERKKAGESFIADVLTIDNASIDSPGSVPKFRFGPQPFKILTDVNDLSGGGLSLLQGGDLEVVEMAGSIIANGLFTGGNRPLLEYRINDGVVKPKTSKSLAMLSAMYQFDSLVANIELLTGKKPEEFSKEFGSLRVLFQPAILMDDDGEQVRNYETSNAAYVAGAKQFALFKTSDSEKVPLSFNPQIIAHEFGHAIFETAFYANNYQTCDSKDFDKANLFKGRLELEYVIRGLNEGFADFVSFAWTGSSNVLESSIGKSSASAQRNFSEITFDYDAWSSVSNSCSGGFYCLGSVWARTLLDIYQGFNFDVRNGDQRKQFLRELVGMLKSTSEKLRANNGAALPPPDADIEMCKPRQKKSGIIDDEMLGTFLKAFVESSSASSRKLYCEKIALRFGSFGFANKFRGSCS